MLKQWNKMSGDIHTDRHAGQVRWGDDKFSVNLTLNSWMYIVIWKSKQLKQSPDNTDYLKCINAFIFSLFDFCRELRQHRTWVHYWYWKSINRTNDFIYYLLLESMANNRKALSSWQGHKQQFWKVPPVLSQKHITVKCYFSLVEVHANFEMIFYK